MLSQWSPYSLNDSDPAYSNTGLCWISMQDCIYINILLTIIIFVLKYTAVPKTLAVNRTDSVSQTAVKPGRVLPIQWCKDLSDFQ